MRMRLRERVISRADTWCERCLARIHIRRSLVCEGLRAVARAREDLRPLAGLDEARWRCACAAAAKRPKLGLLRRFAPLLLRGVVVARLRGLASHVQPAGRSHRAACCSEVERRRGLSRRGSSSRLLLAQRRRQTRCCCGHLACGCAAGRERQRQHLLGLSRRRCWRSALRGAALVLQPRRDALRWLRGGLCCGGLCVARCSRSRRRLRLTAGCRRLGSSRRGTSCKLQSQALAHAGGRGLRCAGSGRSFVRLGCKGAGNRNGRHAHCQPRLARRWRLCIRHRRFDAAKQADGAARVKAYRQTRRYESHNRPCSFPRSAAAAVRIVWRATRACGVAGVAALRCGQRDRDS